MPVSGLRIALLLGAALFISGCNEKSAVNYVDLSPKMEKRLTPEIRQKMQAKSMKLDSPIMARIFKEEGKVEIWKRKTNGRYDVIAEYDICKYSGKLGPKFTEGDRQAPEGYYVVRPAQMKPNSQYHLAFNIGYPNAFDRANGRTGSNLMVHGACSSSGCFSMTDEQMEQIYAFGREAFKGGQTEFQIQSYPFRMTAENMARYKDDPNYAFWKNLKEGYDHFEITKVPPKVDVCEKRYVFNQDAGPNGRFDPKGACPASTQPDALRTAYQSHQSKFDAAFTAALGKNNAAIAPKPTIRGMKEASLVSDWSRKRARGEKVPAEPPTLQADGSVVNTTTTMVRANNEAGRRLAALEAEEEAKTRAAEAAARKVAEEKAAAEAAELAKAQEAEVAKAVAAAAKAEAEAAKAQAAAKTVAAPAAEAPAEAAAQTASAEQPPAQTAPEPESRTQALKRRLMGLIGG